MCGKHRYVSLILNLHDGRVSKWLKGADCKSVQLCCSLVRIQSLPLCNFFCGLWISHKSFFCDFDGCCLSEEWSPALARGRRCACINATGGKTNVAIARCEEIPALLKVKNGPFGALLFILLPHVRQVFRCCIYCGVKSPQTLLGQFAERPAYIFFCERVGIIIGKEAPAC